MDFGIRAALATSLNVIGDVARGTGRTTWAIGEAVRTGAVLCVTSAQERDQIRRRLRNEGKPDVPIFIVQSLRHLVEVQATAGLRSPIVLDHFCHEALYREAIQDVAERIGVYDKAWRNSTRAQLEHEIATRRPGEPALTLSPAAFALYEERMNSKVSFEPVTRRGRSI